MEAKSHGETRDCEQPDPMSLDALFQPLQLGGLTLPNRVIMAPLTRARAGSSVGAHLLRAH